MVAARQVVFVLVPGVHLLDLAGPAQVFEAASRCGGSYAASYVADRREVDTAQGIAVVAAVDPPDLGPRDTVLVPGWRVGPQPPQNLLSPRQLDLVRRHAASGRRVASVCAGAFGLAEAGLLDGRRATTHHDVQDELARRYPRARIVPDVLYVRDAEVFTSAGVASGIDLALHLVALDHGPAVAARTARDLVVATRRNGDAPQESVMFRHRAHLCDLVHRAQDVIDAEYTASLPLADLAAELATSPRTLTRAFVEHTGRTPHTYQRALRLERAHQLLAQGVSRERAARDVGFSDARMLRRLLNTERDVPSVRHA